MSLGLQNILIISQTIFPRESPRANRATELAKELARQGHSITLYAVLGSYNYDKFETEFNIKVKDIGKLYLSNVSSSDGLKQKVFVEKFLSKIFRGSLMYPDIELMFRIPNIIKNETKKDLIITIAQPHSIHWGLALAKYLYPKKNSFTWVADCGDPFMGNEVVRPPFFYFKYLEKWFCESADYISIPVEGAKAAYYNEFRYKVRVIPQGFQFSSIKQYIESRNNPVPTFAFAGLLFKGSRDPSQLLKYLSTLDLNFKFYIFSNNSNLITPHLKGLEDKVVHSKYIPRNKLLSVLGKMDFLLNFENQTNVQSPSKLIEYAILEKPILSINNNSFSRDKIDQFLEGNYSNQKEMRNIEQYNIENISKEFTSLYSNNQNN